MKKIFCVLLSVFIIASFGCVYAAEVKVTDIENDIITVSGENANGGNVFIAVLNPNCTIENVSDDYLSSSVAVHTATGGYKPAGKWNFDLKMLPDPVAGGGAYTFFITSAGKKEVKTVNFYSSDFKKSLIEYVNEHTESEIISKIDEIILKFSLSEHELFKKGNSADIAKCLVALRNGFDSRMIPLDNTKMEELLLDSMLLSALKLSNDEALVGDDGYMKYFAEILSITENSKYIDYCNSINTNGVKAINSALLGKNFSSAEAIVEEFEENVLVHVITDYKQNGYGHVSEYLEKYENDYENAGFKKMDKLTSSISRQLASSNISTLEGLKKEFNSLVNGDKKSSSGGGSGTGGSNAGNSVYGEGFVANPNVPSAVFGDIEGYSWAKTAIEALYKMGVVNGKESGMFAPADLLSRAELTKMIVCAFEMKSNDNADFADINGHWAKEYIKIAGALGIINGVGNGNFAPDDLITREQAAKIIYGAITYANGKAGEASGNEKFADDNSIADYAYDAVYYMRGNGIISGKDGNVFAPKDNLTRAEAAKMVYGSIVHHKEN